MKPLSDKIAILPDTTSKKLASGIQLPDNARKTTTQTGKVVAVGPGFLLQSGERVAPGVSVGDKVVFSIHAGAEVDIDDVIYILLNEEQILAVL